MVDLAGRTLVDYFPTGSCPLAAERHVSSPAYVAMPWGVASSQGMHDAGLSPGCGATWAGGNRLWLIVKQADGLARFLAAWADTYHDLRKWNS